MRRRHNIALATIAFVGTILLVAQHRGEHRHTHVTHASYDTKESNTGIEVLPSDLQPPSHSHGASGSGTDPEKHVTLHDNGSPAQGVSEGDRWTTPLLEHPSPDGQTILEPEYAFQKDLDLLLPIPALQRFSTQKPHNYVPGGTETYAYATFLATRNGSLKDPYFLAIHSLIYRLLWSPKSRTEKHPLIVFVADYVSHEQRALLSGAGALVRELAPLAWSPNVSGVQARWRDLFAKVHMWRETEFARILFLDADAFPLARLDQVFHLAEPRACVPDRLHVDDFLADGPVCERYVFAGIPQDPLHPRRPNLNVGTMLFTPSARMHRRLVQNYVKTDRYDCTMAEQAFLNWQFAPDSAFPPTTLEREWGGFFPQDDEQGRLKVVHEKIWASGPGWMLDEWAQGWRDMIAFYEGDEFVRAREADGRLER